MSIPSYPIESPARAPLISLVDVGVFFERRTGLFRKPDRFWALRSISIEVYKGETLGIIGRNGAGKSTLLRVLGGIYRPNEGEVRCHSISVTLLALQVGFLPSLTGRDNVILSGMLLGCSRPEIEANLDRIIEFAEIGDFIDQPLRTYSSGMRARLGFSTAYFVDPDVILIDETLGVGDAAFVQKSSRAIRERIKSDKTVVLVSHQAQKINQLCDRAIWIDKGEFRMSGEPAQVVDAYLEAVVPGADRATLEVDSEP